MCIARWGDLFEIQEIPNGNDNNNVQQTVDLSVTENLRMNNEWNGGRIGMVEMWNGR